MSPRLAVITYLIIALQPHLSNSHFMSRGLVCISHFDACDGYSSSAFVPFHGVVGIRILNMRRLFLYLVGDVIVTFAASPGTLGAS